jgi:uncharacterized lipoprotein YmbA
MRSRPTSDRRPERVRLRLALAAAAVVLGACGTPPPTHFYSLMPGEVVPRAGQGASPAVGLPIVLEPVRMPTQVDQPQWLVRLPDDSVAVLEQERWAGPLQDEFRAALLEQLIVGHGAIDARTQPSPAPAPWRITVDVRRFDSSPGIEARIEGSWLIQGGAGRAPSSRCEWLLREPAPGPIGAVAAAHRRAIARLADAISAVLARLARGETPACPALDERR